MRGGEGGEGDHLALVVAGIPASDVLGRHAGRSVSLEKDLFDAALVNEVIDVSGAPDVGQFGIDAGEGEAEGAGFFLVNIQSQLRCVEQPIRSNTDEGGVLRSHAD